MKNFFIKKWSDLFIYLSKTVREWFENGSRMVRQMCAAWAMLLGKCVNCAKSLMQIFATFATYASAIFVGKESNESTVRYALWSRISLIKPLQNPYKTLTRFRLSLGSAVSRFSLASLICLCMLTVGSGNVWGTVLFHETFGNNTSSARAWNDSYSVKSGVSSVYSGVKGYTITNAKQSINTGGSTQSGLIQTTSGTDAVFIVGPLSVASYNSLVVTYQWKAASIKKTYSTSLYYKTSSSGSYTEVSGTGNGATTYVTRTYNLPVAAQVSTLYIKVVFNTSNTQALIDEFELTGTAAVVSCTENPTVTASSNSSITSTTARVSCSSGISSLGSAGCSISSYGFVIGSSANPSIGDDGVTKHEVGKSYTTTGTSFSKDLTGLTPGATYYVRSYATNGNGSGYGTQTSFTMLNEYTLTFKEWDGGGAASGSPSTGTVVQNATSFSFGATAPTKTGHTIEGFYTNTSASSGVKVANSSRQFVAGVTDWTDGSSHYTGSNANLYIKWAPETYTISSSLSGCSWETDIADASYEYTGDVNAVSGTVNPNSGKGCPSSITVTMGGSTLTPSTDYTWSVNTAGVGTFLLKKVITGDVVVTISAQPMVKWMAGGQIYSSQIGSFGTALTNPGTPDNGVYCDGTKVFVGWSATNIGATPTNTEPTDLFPSADATSLTIPAEGKSYYAVFAAVTGTYGKFKRVTSSSASTDIAAGQQIAIVAYDANNSYKNWYILGINAAGTAYTDASAPSETSSQIDTPAKNYIWTISKSGDYWIFTNKKTTSKKIAASTTTSNNALNISTQTYDKWAYGTNSYGTNTFYLRQYGSSALTDNGLERYGGSWKIYGGSYDSGNAFQLKFYVPDYTASGYVTTCGTTYTVTKAGSGTVTGGTFTASPTTAIEDATITLEATPSADYRFGSWTITNTSSSADITNSVSLSGQTASATFSMPAANVTVTPTFVAKCQTPTFSVSAGTYNNDQSVTITCATSSATIKYTTDGRDPVTYGTTYSTPVTINADNTTLKAVAIKAGHENSEVASATYRLKCATPTFTPTPGLVDSKYLGTQSVAFNTTTTGSITFYYTTDGSTTPTTSSTEYSSAIDVSSTTTLKAIATKANYQNSDVATQTFTITNAYTVTWMNRGSLLTTTRVEEGEKPTFPTTAKTGCDTYTSFYGWANNTWNGGKTTIAAPPAGLAAYTTSSAMPDVDGDVTYHAVWTNSFRNVHTSNLTLPGSSPTNGIKCQIHVESGDGYASYTAFKLGKTDQTSANITVTVPANTTYLSLHGVGWNSGTAGVVVSTEAEGVEITTATSPTTLQQQYNARGNITTSDDILFNEGHDFVEYSLSGVSTATTLTIASSGYPIIIWGINSATSGSEPKYITSCCDALSDANASVKSSTYNSVTLQWDNIANVDTWAVTCKKKSDGTSAGTPSDISIVSTKKNITFTGLDQYTDYVFTISATADEGYCDTEWEVETKTPCVAPSSLSISSTGSKWDFCAGESMTLTVNGANVSASATYQWQKHNGSAWVDIDGANSASYTVASMAASNAGQYRCTVTNPGSSCDATTDGAWVRLWQLYINNGTADAFQSLDFSNTGTGTGSNTSVYLTSDKGYQFKLIDNNGGYFGLNSKTVTTNESNITLNGTGANVNVTSGLEGNYTFAIDYTSKNNPKVSITYPVGNQPAGRKIWFDKSVIPDWNTAGTGNLCWRIGKPSHTLTNQDDIEDVHPNYFSLVPGTDRFYVYETKAYDGFEAWSVANNVAWSGSSTNDPAYDNHGIYTHYHGDGTDVTRSTVYQKYVVGESGVTLVPTTKYGETNWYCDFYSVTKTDCMLKHEATITSYSHGTVTVAYTKYDGTGAASFTSGSNSDLAHRCILTITAVPDPGYNLTSLQVNSANFTSGNEHILSADATITAVFSPKTTTVTFDKNSGTGGDNGVTATYDADMPTVSVPSRSNYNFGGYFDAETNDNGSGTKYYNANGTSAKIWDKEDAALTLYAQWTGDSYTISYKDHNNEPYSGSNLASLPTSHTYGAATALANGVKTGYTFGGWFDNSSCTGAAVTSIGATAITANTTYYAKWTETDYTVTMAQSPAAGASLTGGTTTAHYNGTINISTNVPAGYAFNGWTSSPSVTFADASATSTSFTMPAGDVTITANFLQTHSATFIGPDGSTLQTVNAIEGAAVAYSASTPETCDDGVDPSNYFVGWATNTWSGKVAKGSIVPTFYDIANGDNLPNMGASDVTYYAVFAKRSGTPLTNHEWVYTFTTNKYGSSGSAKEITRPLDGTESAVTVNKDWTLEAYGPLNEDTWEYDDVYMQSKDDTKGIKIGTNDVPAATMTLTSSSFSGTITAVKISTSGNSSVSATVSATVNGNSYTSGGNSSLSITSSNAEYAFTGNQTISGQEIVFFWAQSSSKALYIKKIEVDYTTGGDVSYSNYMTSCATCVTPSGLAASAITESGATITWSGTSASGTEGFKVAWNTTNSVPSPLTGSNSADVAKNVKTYDITGLNDGTTYYVFVQSKCNSEWSSSTNFTTLAKHDITFTKDNGTLSVVSPVGVVHGETLTFPNVTSTSCGTFVGWKVTEVSDYDNAAAPSPLYKYNDTKENITADESYQAVYRTASGAETNVTDNVTVALTGITGTYGAWSNKTAASAATYAGNTAKNSTNQIQMRSSDDSGIISTISGGKLEQVDVTWASNTSGRTVQIYGKATPYSATSDLYSNDDNVKGTLLGELVYTSDGGTSTLEIDGTYNYIGIKSKSGAAYATNIGIQWWGSEAHYMTAPTCNAMVGITASFSSFTYVYGSGPSATQTFIVSGLNLSTNPLVVTAPTNYEISKTVDGTYTSSVSYTPVAGKVSAETVYIRLKGGLSVGTYNYAAASGVSAASEGATTQKVALNGSVTKASGSIAFTSFNAVDHYEAEMPKGGTSLDVTLTVSVTGDGAVSYVRSPAAGSSAVPATTPTTTLHVTTVGTWTVTANLTAGTSYTSASTTCQVVVYYADHYYDNIHSDVQALVDIDMPLERRGSYSAPDLMDSDKSTGSCAATHYKFMGWISKTAIDGGLANDAAYKAALIPAGTAMTATGESYYAVWAELEE